MNIVLAGMPGSGKSTVARSLSRLINAPAFDTDEEIVKKYGDINSIFAKYGEETFRDMESEAVMELSALNGIIIATGGGCLLREENVNFLKSSGKIIYLRARFETLVSRVKGNGDRPLLSGDAEAKMRVLFYERSPLYDATADYTIDTDWLSPREIALGIVKLIK